MTPASNTLAPVFRIGAVIVALATGVFVPYVAAKASWIDGSTAMLQGLDKITARISTLDAPVGTVIEFGTLAIIVHRCAYHPPEEPPEDAAFVEIIDQGHDHAAPDKPMFSGWMFSSSPAISALEHPVYDVTLLGCE